jgi:DNA-binding SARP family transcriptional activator
LSLSVFGPVTLTCHAPDGSDQELTPILAPKHKALLVFLALHPSGATRDAVREALWPESGGNRPFNAFYAGLSQIRKVLSTATDEQTTELFHQRGELVTLDPAVVSVDYWHLEQAEYEQRRAATDSERLAAWEQIAAVYRGELAEGMSALWLEGPREAAHRTAVDALVGMASHHRGLDPQRQLQLLEHARVLDPENEALYREIMQVQSELGLSDAISRTVQLLTATLADIGERPEPATLTFAKALQNRMSRPTRSR